MFKGIALCLQGNFRRRHIISRSTLVKGLLTDAKIQKKPDVPAVSWGEGVSLISFINLGGLVFGFVGVFGVGLGEGFGVEFFGLLFVELTLEDAQPVILECLAA